MQCIHFVKVEPFSVGDYLTLEPHYIWLRQNGIKRFRTNNKMLPSFNDGHEESYHTTFRFADIEDAMAFKLRWC